MRVGLQRQRAFVVGESRAELAADRSDVGAHEKGVGEARALGDERFDDAPRLIELAQTGEGDGVFFAAREVVGARRMRVAKAARASSRRSSFCSDAALR